MKTFETEKGNIPEGATHYMNESSYTQFAWGKINCFGVYTMKLYEDEWCHLGSEIFINGFNEIPQTKEVEWVNGDECLFTDKNGDTKTCKVIGLYPPFVESYVLHCESANPTFFISNVGRMIKPETEAERKEREEIEAASYLLSDWFNAIGKDMPEWSSVNEDVKAHYLRIARKTNYKVKGE
ncbi:hypothetical protein NVP1231O_07 [Vibrio phage 1.231.O._10N.261.49.F8]|nr:hypothetical protein NVP1119O_07 [Vibrio phage 1.119.O._10N.261.51.A9]AUR90379.1 hypothetical protein NVP1143O_07 [Vibrio phage 1.143.O._10N.261.55.C8]AUR96665.1 hypothetical protein NVP1231O_07 [Vibrio phage 1.231.O._10N.261.49.F8]